MRRWCKKGKRLCRTEMQIWKMDLLFVLHFCQLVRLVRTVPHKKTTTKELMEGTNEQ